MKMISSRRKILRGMFHGTAVALALPRLEFMLNGNGDAWAQGGALPKAFGVWAKANGVHRARWVPTSTGPGYTLSAQLMPLASVKEHFTIVTGTNLPRVGANPARGHSAMNTILMTGVGMTGRGDDTYTAGGKSIDQMVADSYAMQGVKTPRRSLEVGVATGPGHEAGTAFHWWSHNGPNSANICNYSCKEVFDLLFTGAKPAAPAGMTPAGPAAPVVNVTDTTAKTKQSIIDFCKADADDLMKTLGAADKMRMQQHLEGIRLIEQRIQAAANTTTKGGGTMPGGAGVAGSGCRTPVPPSASLVGSGGDYNANVKLINKTMAELVALAVACDITRVFTFQVMQPGCRVNVSTIIGKSGSYHGLSHGNSADESCHKVQLAMMDELRVFIETFRDTKDGAGSLLDRCAIMASDDTDQGPDHGFRDWPFIVFGKAGGMKLGQHIRVDGENALKIPLTVARAAGATVPKLGDATESLAQLLG
jgi:hypothetical protein